MNAVFARVLAAVLLVGLPVAAVDAASKAIQFAKGKSGTTVSGKVTGDDDAIYEIRAGAGQTMTVDFKASKGAAFFSILPPGGQAGALFDAMAGGNHFEGALPADGVYKIVVYLKGAAKDSGKPVNFSLKIGITGGASAPAAKTGRASPSEKACLAAVATQTGAKPADLAVDFVSDAQSGVLVTVKVPNATAPWTCLTDHKGKVLDVKFSGTE